MKKMIISLGLLLALSGCVQNVPKSSPAVKEAQYIKVKSLLDYDVIVNIKNITLIVTSGKDCMIFFLSSNVPFKTEDCREVLKLMK
ncbi:MAG: lipoprotein [Nitrosopumilus sp.]